jgi:PhzF family phenazine biosynthesis protein
MPIRLYHVDAFAERPFTGNPAAVCLLPGPRDEAWMQHVAAENNLSETAFVSPEADDFRLRWFTPKIEVSLCGHATLASAHVLWEAGHVAGGQPIAFHTHSGVLTAARSGDMITLDFPVNPAEAAPPPAGLTEALAVEPVWTGRSRFDWLVEVQCEARLRELAPDSGRLAQVSARGIIVTSPPTTHGYDFISRFFAPAAGIAEDPVTGSAHCCLADYWGRKLGKTTMVGYQASARGGVVQVRVAGDRVLLSGHAITVIRGELLVDS